MRYNEFLFYSVDFILITERLILTGVSDINQIELYFMSSTIKATIPQMEFGKKLVVYFLIIIIIIIINTEGAFNDGHVFLQLNFLHTNGRYLDM